tara:strand:+ start:846 stop:1007 length:162 start_codon:yes stop_codon:yes gene_type:complete
MTYGNDVFEKGLDYYHPDYGRSTETMNTDEKFDALLELINQLECRISDLENNS